MSNFLFEQLLLSHVVGAIFESMSLEYQEDSNESKISNRDTRHVSNVFEGDCRLGWVNIEERGV